MIEIDLIKNSRNRTSHQASNVGYDDAHQVVLAINTLIKHLVVPPTPELLCSLYKAKNALFKNSRVIYIYIYMSSISII